MSYTRRELDAADRHIHLAERNIEIQKNLIQELIEQRLPAHQGYEVLGKLQEELHDLRRRRERMQADVTVAA
jgi:hypothetical protein